MNCSTILKTLNSKLKTLSFPKTITHVYSPLDYAGKSFTQYFEKYAPLGAKTVLIGMNPGPWGMAQTGIPFGEITAVKDWLKINAQIRKPKNTHPKKPVLAYDCHRREVSGQRLWGWAKNKYKTPQKFFQNFFVLNYCPLMFLDKDSKNITPDKLPKTTREALEKICNEALQEFFEILKPKTVIGVGKYAYHCCQKIFLNNSIQIGTITHPSPANPKANRGWQQLIEKELKAFLL